MYEIYYINAEANEIEVAVLTEEEYESILN
jgi:hypothetical protein